MQLYIVATGEDDDIVLWDKDNDRYCMTTQRKGATEESNWGDKGVLTSALVKADYDRTAPKAYFPKSEISGNPQMVATNGSQVIVKRGTNYYGMLDIGQSIKEIKKWEGKELLTSALEDKGYIEIDPPEDYTFR